MSRPERDREQEDQVGEVVPFQRADDEQATVVDSTPAAEVSDRPDEVVDAEIVDEEDRAPVVPVDPPRQPAAPPWAVGAPTRRPVIAPWLLHKDQRRAAERWLAVYLGHTTAYHVVRLPLYALQVALQAPRGAARLAGRMVRWVGDAEAGPLRSAAVRREDTAEYLKLAAARADRVRWRRITAGAGALAGAVALGGLSLAPWWAQLAVVIVAAVGLAYVGRSLDRPFIGPAVTVPKAQRLTSEIVVRGLAALGVPGINQAVAKNPGGSGWFPAPITRDGPGWRADVELPHGVTVVDIVERRDRLASGLRRPLGCVWPEPATEEHPGRLVLWVGDQSLSQQKPAPWPLARRGTVDLFDPFPFGQDQRGRPVGLDLMYGNLLIGSLPGAGKTMALRIPLLAAALDPTAELRIFELKGSGDLGALERVAHHYGSGPGDDTIEACLESLREVYADLTRRAATISGLPKDLAPENKVIAELARKRTLRLHPMVVAIDECQELFSHPDYGKEAGGLCTAIIKRGRALGVILLLATQRPDKDSLPTGVSANVGIRFCLRVMGQTENDMILGTSAYKNGLRATMFTTKDRGIGYLVGASDESQITRTYYVDNPGAEAVAIRARAAREAAGTLSGAAIGDTPHTAPAASLLDDLQVVFATAERLWSEQVCELLAELRPEVYGGWTPDALAAALKPLGIETRQISMTVDGERFNRRGVHREQLATAVAARAERRELAQ
ncbi:MAG: FtsK/SpoIIIE domain-containing protein [Pseudonocardiaceae bacterium]